MSKLFKLRKFFTIDEAREYLCNTLEEKVTQADVYRFALDGHLTISVKFLGMIVMSPGRIFEETSEVSSPDMLISKGMSLGEELKEPYWISKVSGFPMSLREWLFFGKEIMYANGIWDLAMLGQEYEYIEKLYLKEAGGFGSLDGFSGRIKAVVLKRYDSFCKLKDIERPLGLPEREVPSFIDNASNNYFFDCLDLDGYPHQLVIKTEELTRFVLSLQGEPMPKEEKQVDPRERNTFLVVIGALCNQVGIEPSQRGVAKSVAAMTDEVGAPVSEGTIKSMLDQVSMAIERRQK